MQEVAVKVISRDECADFNLVSREVNSHRILVHPHVIRFKRLGLTPDKRFLFMGMEYADRGDLLDYLRRRGRFREHEARCSCAHIADEIDAEQKQHGMMIGDPYPPGQR
ncbi:Serine/threonine-protein kinase SAPK9 [Tetrabaena socialis]|uniref:non-specific serine/threonine protein kinase n=1 Tax=Tetrabaena socialis TaxID=47790 RepID=A0A2J8AHY7_9CHLO|nr:Serine/threonine-protein kinase SAPK9 [Tetrabaena socialis]|eukprot:PNH12135.1 Serine/threonine-protein kinase SAPK9 [Tetrabaena socialis]